MPTTFPEHHFTTIDLTDDAIYAAIVQYWHERIVEENISQLLKDTAFLQQWLQRTPAFSHDHPDRFAEINLLLQEASWITLPAHTAAEQTLPLFQNGLLTLFNLQAHQAIPNGEYNLAELCLTERLRERLVNINLFTERDALKKQLVEALLHNEEVITTAEFFRDIKQTQGTLKNWFAEYVEYMGSEELMKSRHELFFAKNENAQRISALEKQRLQLLFKTYHQLKISSTKQYGIEEEVAIDTDNNKTGKIIYGTVFMDDDQLKQQARAVMKNYKDLATKQGWRDPHYLYDLEPRPAVAAVFPKTSLTFKPETTTGPDIAATKGPDHFTEQDEAEIKQQGVVVIPSALINYDQVIADIKQELALSFATPDQDKRFSELMISVLRGLRDTMELKQYLIDLALPSADIAAIIAAVEQHLTPRKPTKTGAAPKLASKPTLAQIAKQSAASVGTGRDLSLQDPSVPSPDMVPAQPPQPKKTFLPKLKRSRTQRRPMIDDVKLQPSMMMGPIDELRAMDTIEFRRLSADPVQTAARLHDRITLLAEESIAKEAEGINAFKQSPLNTLYLELGNESIASGKAVSDVITEREAKGVPTLSVAEFNAIADLNTQLRF